MKSKKIEYSIPQRPTIMISVPLPIILFCGIYLLLK